MNNSSGGGNRLENDSEHTHCNSDMDDYVASHAVVLPSITVVFEVGISLLVCYIYLYPHGGIFKPQNYHRKVYTYIIFSVLCDYIIQHSRVEENDNTAVIPFQCSTDSILSSSHKLDIQNDVCYYMHKMTCTCVLVCKPTCTFSLGLRMTSCTCGIGVIDVNAEDLVQSGTCA